MAKTLSVQDILNRRHNLSKYESLIAVETTQVTKDVSLDQYFSPEVGDNPLTFGPDNPAHELHLSADSPISIYINGGQEIFLEEPDLPFVINNMDVTRLNVTCSNTSIKVVAYYFSS